MNFEFLVHINLIYYNQLKILTISERDDKMFSIGIDFGTESGRVLIVDKYGKIVSASIVHYKHKVITERLPTEKNTFIPKGYALQHPADYLEVLQKGIPSAIHKANITNKNIAGVGVAFTSSTILAIDNNLVPLCLHERYRESPQAWVKLWKHHGAQKEAARIYDTAIERKEKWLSAYGNNVSAEWFLPKCLETFYKDPKLFHDTNLFIEAGDWIVSILIGKIVRSNCSLGFKTFWSEADGFPYDFIKALDPKFGESMSSKLKGDIKNVGEKAGKLTKNMAEKIGLLEDTPVAVSIIDAHSSLLGIGASKEKQLTMVMGTSTCHLTLNKHYKNVPGISGSVKDAVIPGLYTYEAGQSAVGDLFGWYSKQIPFDYEQEAKRKGLSVFQLLENKAKELEPGESGLVALDWHNGNRSILSNFSLSGTLIGMTLKTSPEEIYRSLLEASAFGTKIILDTYKNSGLSIEEVFACGGLPLKSDLLMQIYADVLNKNIMVSETKQASGIGAAILGAVAGNLFNKVNKASQNMGQSFTKEYKPIKKNVIKYQKLFDIYKQIHDYFGKENAELMWELNNI